MADYRTMFEDPSIKAWDLAGKDVTVRIREVKVGKVGHGQKAAKKPLVYFEKTEKYLALNKTTGKTIAAMYGPDTRAWVGKRITLFPTTTDFGGDQVDCIRVRPRVPPDKAVAEGVQHRPGGEEQQAKKDAAAAKAEGQDGAGESAPPAEGNDDGLDRGDDPDAY